MKWELPSGNSTGNTWSLKGPSIIRAKPATSELSCTCSFKMLDALGEKFDGAANVPLGAAVGIGDPGCARVIVVCVVGPVNCVELFDVSVDELVGAVTVNELDAGVPVVGTVEVLVIETVAPVFCVVEP